jgi:threonine/homoserine/homoserine lactone efflux protein
VIETSIALVIFLFPLAYSPGPGNMFFAANGARFGLRATLWANLGYHIATLLVTAIIGFGFVTAMDTYPKIFTTLKVAGALYVLWLAWKMFRAGALEGEETAQGASFMDGAVLLLLNPKAYVIIALMFTQFLTPSEANMTHAVLLITTVFTVNNFIAFMVWTLVGDAISRRFRSAASARWLNTIFSAILAGVAVWMLLS